MSTAPPHDEQRLDLLAKLLRQAESTTYESEAQAFMARAQTLATRWSIDLAVARAASARAEQRERPEEQGVTIGEPGTPGLAQLTRLFLAVAEVNDVHCLITTDSARVFAYGFPSDIEVCRALYASLVVQMVSASDAYLRSGRHREEVAVSYDSRLGRWVAKPMHGKTARREFHIGFTARVHERLRAARDEAAAAAQAEADAARAAAAIAGGARPESGQQRLLPVSVALVLAEKSQEVADFFESEKIRQRVRTTWRGEQRQRGGYSEAARHAGDRAGRRARLTDRAQSGSRELRPGAG